MYQRTIIIMIVLLLVTGGCGAPAAPEPTTAPEAAAAESEAPTQPPPPPTVTEAPPSPTPLPPTDTPEPTPTTRPDGWVTFETANSPVSRTGHAMAMLPDGSVLLFGGRDENGNALNDTWVFNPQVHSLIPADGVKLASLGSPGWLATGLARPLFRDWEQVNPVNSPDARYGHSMVTLPDGRVMLFGGINAAGEVRNDMHVFANNDWNEITLANGTPPARYGHAALAPDSIMVIQGGLGQTPDGKTILYDDMWSCDTDCGTDDTDDCDCEQWDSPPDTISPNAYPVMTDSTVHFVDVHRYTYSGGADYVYNMAENRWEQVKVTNPPPGQRGGYMMVQVGDKAYMMGGGIYDPDTQTSTYIAEVWMLDLITNAWTQLEDMPYTIGQGAAVYDPVQNRTIVWGGKQGDETFLPPFTVQISDFRMLSVPLDP
ncbi:MAG: hypothetical protein ISS57_12605 [Anaerolineales bacterium]|nr:hypothetical protein [Anaerolineales bacterium]